MTNVTNAKEVYSTDRPLRILLCDDHALVMDGIRSRLECFEHINIVGEAGTGAEALTMADDLHPDIVLMDISMPVMNGLEAAEKFRETLPGTKVVILSMHENPEYLRTAQQAGAKGFILKDVSSNDMVRAIETVANGGEAFSSTFDRITDGEDTASDGVPLTSRERTVLRLLAKGASNKHVARELDISVRTVETHRRNIKRKLDIDSSAGLVRYAIEKGLVTLDSTS
ncbi:MULTISPECIES: response regulator transcription factor [Thalassospira]|jgi:two-component system, NarL family, nitrate/nitrite response regulator NarL|uniref:LuxR family transcriptional regulator n=1 Tax=Thalassospira profundimaris TaxID=502049 RepID=A0A367VIX9_9PROT|nr:MULTISPECIES: response regulator transcription factor [Thalassospira]MBR9899150.1 response regulator transcription factor [Rhodospirillales bacterium]HCK19333.1 DNA-binding response regulator [Thalassospira sp.]KZB71164.1 LuxR family transcriptional regulator [Thalassospira sp. MCCC 1A01148]MBS8273244.1 DNA-binding response regulator [Thalassospira tepidiphila]RCK25175.1 LuxR family transcriptional regulator [Thalassospira profundimaris]|tara:strand:+ start:250 stop:930 length:681 start_codon:yes stop_codon:yes gene_type:complete